MLKKQLIRKPGIEVTDKLKMKENEVREKSRQMKAMAGELNMNQAQVRNKLLLHCQINVLFLIISNTYFPSLC